jgi:uncharacterized protein YbjT (DUF2867 family)
LTQGKTALIAGGTGLVGGFVLKRLLAHSDYRRVEIWVRRELPIHHPKLNGRVVDFARLDDITGKIEADEVYCCLGTTIKKAGSQAAFRRVDHDYPLALARIARASGAEKFLMVSALGADPKSPVFYSRVKGEAEQAIAATGLSKAYFFRPSILFGPREEKRPGEKIGIALGKLIVPLLIGGLRKYRPIHADTVAAAMVYVANHEIPAGPIESDAIARLASEGLQ